MSNEDFHTTQNLEPLNPQQYMMVRSELCLPERLLVFVLVCSWTIVSFLPCYHPGTRLQSSTRNRISLHLVCTSGCSPTSRSQKIAPRCSLTSSRSRLVRGLLLLFVCVARAFRCAFNFWNLSSVRSGEQGRPGRCGCGEACHTHDSGGSGVPAPSDGRHRIGFYTNQRARLRVRARAHEPASVPARPSPSSSAMSQSSARRGDPARRGRSRSGP